MAENQEETYYRLFVLSAVKILTTFWFILSIGLLDARSIGFSPQQLY